MTHQPEPALTGIELPLQVDLTTRSAVCRGVLQATKHRLEDLTIDLVPLEGEWRDDVRWAADELKARFKPRYTRLTKRPKPVTDWTIEVNPRDDHDFEMAHALSPHAWITAIANDHSIALDSETFVRAWLTPAEYVDLVSHVRAAGGRVDLLVPNPSLKPWYA